MARMTAQERRDCVIRSAVTEFARTGYHGTSTGSIAKRAGVSQPYLFRLFPDKRSMFLATLRCMTDTRLTLEAAARGLDGESAFLAMAAAYRRLLTEQPETLQMQLQAFAAVPALAPEGDPGFGEAVRAGWMTLWDIVQAPALDDAERTTRLMAHGVFVAALAATGNSEGPCPTEVVQGPCRTNRPVSRRDDRI
ncbi:TetR/AcrR family transcriptional regulator [Streptomyces sp. NBC_00443]|uniref:TetR/AcrR family transcriptional regulator n=1 Tax=Streptomyces sp. NBC_00443 TaxID=2975743 RepID=UPI002E1D7E4E